MKVEHWEHKNVSPDGKTIRGGAVGVYGDITRSAPGGGCGLPTCHCSDGHWICVAEPRTADGTVSGVTFYFDSEEELQEFGNGLC